MFKGGKEGGNVMIWIGIVIGAAIGVAVLWNLIAAACAYAIGRGLNW